MWLATLYIILRETINTPTLQINYWHKSQAVFSLLKHGVKNSLLLPKLVQVCKIQEQTTMIIWYLAATCCKRQYQDVLAWFATALFWQQVCCYWCCQQTSSNLIIKTSYSQVCSKLFQQAVTSPLMTSCNQLNFNRLVVVGHHLLDSIISSTAHMTLEIGHIGCHYCHVF